MLDVTFGSTARGDGIKGCTGKHQNATRRTQMLDNHYALPGVPDFWSALMQHAIQEDDEVCATTDQKRKAI
jgi:hypothetical protein